MATPFTVSLRAYLARVVSWQRIRSFWGTGIMRISFSRTCPTGRIRNRSVETADGKSKAKAKAFTERIWYRRSPYPRITTVTLVGYRRTAMLDTVGFRVSTPRDPMRVPDNGRHHPWMAMNSKPINSLLKVFPLHGSPHRKGAIKKEGPPKPTDLRS